MFKNYRTAIAASFTFVLSVHWHSEEKSEASTQRLEKEEEEAAKKQQIYVRVNIKSEI